MLSPCKQSFPRGGRGRILCRPLGGASIVWILRRRGQGDGIGFRPFTKGRSSLATLCRSTHPFFVVNGVDHAVDLGILVGNQLKIERVATGRGAGRNSPLFLRRTLRLACDFGRRPPLPTPRQHRQNGPHLLSAASKRKRPEFPPAFPFSPQNAAMA